MVKTAQYLFCNLQKFLQNLAIFIKQFYFNIIPPPPVKQIASIKNFFCLFDSLQEFCAWVFWFLHNFLGFGVLGLVNFFEQMLGGLIAVIHNAVRDGCFARLCGMWWAFSHSQCFLAHPTKSPPSDTRRVRGRWRAKRIQLFSCIHFSLVIKQILLSITAKIFKPINQIFANLSPISQLGI